MSINIRPIEIADLNIVVDLLVHDAQRRQAENRSLWKLDTHARRKTLTTLARVLQDDAPPFRQQWLLAEAGGAIVGVTHTILLPVPPIYAGEFGAPGLIMEDCFVSENAPAGTYPVLLQAAEADLKEAGAKLLLASSLPGGGWERVYAERNYEPLTLYLAKVGLAKPRQSEGVRSALESDVPAIVAASAENRQILNDLNTFWRPHEKADARFGAWMARSLTLTDRDMFVSHNDGTLGGYAISQPATQLHFPTPHSLGSIGIIDDFFHADFHDPRALQGAGHSAQALLQTAEAARDARGDNAVLVVCPATWRSKIALLQAAGYENAITWFIKR